MSDHRARSPPLPVALTAHPRVQRDKEQGSPGHKHPARDARRLALLCCQGGHQDPALAEMARPGSRGARHLAAHGRARTMRAGVAARPWNGAPRDPRAGTAGEPG